LKEKLYMDMIHFFDHGRQWERAIRLCRELMKEYENQDHGDAQVQQDSKTQQAETEKSASDIPCEHCGHEQGKRDSGHVTLRRKVLTISNHHHGISDHGSSDSHQQKRAVSASRLDPCHLQMVSGLLKKQADLCDNIQSAIRPTPQYFRVGYYGRGYSPFLQNKEFVYRGEIDSTIKCLISRIEIRVN
jgi:hypothetical protein